MKSNIEVLQKDRPAGASFSKIRSVTVIHYLAVNSLCPLHIN